MTGQRLRDGFDDGIPPKGSYYKDERGVWMCVTPNGRLGSLANHEVVEHEDGTITVSPSILVSEPPHRPSRHGYLEKGVWREC